MARPIRLTSVLTSDHTSPAASGAARSDSRRSTSLLTRPAAAPLTMRPAVRLAQYAPVQAPATAGGTPRDSVKRLYAHWPAATSVPVYRKNVATFIHTAGRRSVSAAVA